MPVYLAPGVYVEEIETGPVPIAAVSTSTTGFVGMTTRGPTTGLPVLVTSFAEFMRNFGGYLPASFGNNRFLAYAAQGFFENGGELLYIKRVISSASPPALAQTASLRGGLVTRLSKDLSTGATQATLATLRGVYVGTRLTLSQTKNGMTTTQTVTVTDYDDSTRTATWDATDQLTSPYEARYTSVATDTQATATTPAIISAVDAGAWGNSISIQVFSASTARAQVQNLVESTPGSGNFDTVVLNSASNFYPWAIVEFNRGKTKVYGKVVSVSGNSIRLKTAFTGANAAKSLDPDKQNFTTTASTCEFRLTASYGGVVEDYPVLTLDDRTLFYYGKLINGNSSLISVSGSDNAAENPFTMPTTADGLNIALTGGSNGGIPSDDDYVGVDNGPGQRSGIQALEDIEDISIVATPGITSQIVLNALINQCELLKYRFAILDPEYQLASAFDAIQAQRQLYDTKYAALYYPRVTINDPLTQASIPVPPSGHMAGIYARTDNERGVHKAPANETISGILNLELLVNKREQEVLNPPPNQINVLRDFRHAGRGLRVWGARCITSDALWKYINVRRLFIFIEASIDRGTQWVVFEPNDSPLWARVTQSITNFLTTVWHDGALMGQKAEEAFFVRCDRTTMTQDDIDNGRLIVLIGIAPVKPAEFVIFRISQFTAAASTAGQ